MALLYLPHVSKLKLGDFEVELRERVARLEEDNEKIIAATTGPEHEISLFHTALDAKTGQRPSPFARVTPVAYPLLVGDPAGTQAPALQVKGLPYTVVIDRNGRFEGSRLGRIDEVTLEATLRQLVGQ